MAGAAALPIFAPSFDNGYDQILFGVSFSAEVLVHPVLEKLWGDLSFVQRLACCLPIGQRVKAGSLLKLSRQNCAFCPPQTSPRIEFCCRIVRPALGRSAYHLGDVSFLYALQAACS